MPPQSSSPSDWKALLSSAEVRDRSASPPPASATLGLEGFQHAKHLLNFVFLALLLTTAWLIYQSYTQVIERVQTANMNLARAVVNRGEAALLEAEQVLHGVVRELGRVQPADDAESRLILDDVVARVDQFDSLVLLDQRGRLVASSGPAVDVSHLQEEAATQPNTVVLGKLVLGEPIAGANPGERLVPVSMAFQGQDGPRRRLMATLSAKAIADLFGRFEIGNGSVTMVLAGSIVAREPGHGPQREFEVPPELLRMLTRAPSGHGDVRSPLDGVHRLFSFERSTRFPLLVIVAAGQYEALGGWLLTSSLQMLWTVFLCLVLLKAGRLAKRILRERLAAEASLRQARDELNDANHRLAQLAHHDSLTGLANRRSFDRRLARAMRVARREQQWLSLVLIDVDDFKQYNDEYGHLAGDQCLRLIADALHAASRRPDDFVARYGGEEFVMVLPNTDADGAMLVAEAARWAVERMQISPAGPLLRRVTLSVGVATCQPANLHSAEELIRAADAAQYESKRHGKNQVTLCVVHSKTG